MATKFVEAVLAIHFRDELPARGQKAKKEAAKPEPAPMSKALKAMGVLKGLQASPNLSDEEKRLLVGPCSLFRFNSVLKG